MTTATPEPAFTGKCASCGTKRDPLRETCATCGENYEYAARMVDAAPSVSSCRDCGARINFIRSQKSGRSIPVNPKPLQGVRSNGVVEQFWIAHQATCEGKSRR